MSSTTKQLAFFVTVLSLITLPGCFPNRPDVSQTVPSPDPIPTESPTPIPSAPASPEPASPKPAAPAPAEPAEPAPSVAVPTSPQAAVPLPEECDNPQTQAQMNVCARVQYEAADKQLNEVYQQLKSRLSGPAEDELVNAELAWIDFRDTHCEFEASQYEGGSIQPTIYYGCLEQVTNERIAELQSQLRNL